MLFYRSSGNPQAPHLILLHGWGFNQAIWNDLATEFRENWHVHQVDLPGHGQSPAQDYGLQSLANILVTELPTPAVWVGWSLGGLLAMAVARWHPQAVKALGLVATSPCFVQRDDWQCAMTTQVLEQFATELDHDLDATLRRFVTLQVHGSDLSRQYLRQLQQTLQESGRAQPATLRNALDLLQNTDLRSELAQIQCPAWLCLGSHDALVPRSVKQGYLQYWEGLHTLTIKSAAHIPFLSHQELFLHYFRDFLHEHVR